MMTEVTSQYLDYLIKCYAKKGWNPPPKWIQFCQSMLTKGWKISLYRAKTTVSKYLYVRKDTYNRTKIFKIRFSNHKANWRKENDRDCDFYVGMGNKGVITTEYLIDLLNKEETNGIKNNNRIK